MEGFEPLFAERGGGESPKNDAKKWQLNSERSEMGVSSDIDSSPWTPVGVSVKRWTPEFIAEVTAYREKHGLKKTAAHYEVSETTIGRYIPGKRKRQQVASGFSWGKR